MCLQRSSGVIKSIADETTKLEIEQGYGYYESFYHTDNKQDITSKHYESSLSVKGDGMRRHNMPWLLSTAEQWQNGGKPSLAAKNHPSTTIYVILSP